MNFPAAFTLHRSPAGTVRVEPPDRVIVDGAFGKLRFQRSEVRTCAPMLVSHYREHYDAELVAHHGDIVIRLIVDGLPCDLLGPFPHAEGIGIAHAISSARRDLLFATPELSVGVSEDAAVLVIVTRPSGMQMTIPIPTTELVEVALRNDNKLDTHHTISSGLAPTAEPRWVELVRAGGKPWLFGPLPASEAITLALAFRAWRAEHPLDGEPVPVEERELLAEPSRWHLRRIVVTGIWQCWFEGSRFAKAWLHVDDGDWSDGTFRVRVVGTWIYPDPKAEGGYGHMGCWPGELRVESLETLEVIDQPSSEQDPLTGLLKRRSLDAAFRREHDGRPLAFALLDYDRFKTLNDTHGHQAGDEVLRRCSKAIAGALRPGDIVARWGGDEVAVIFPNTTVEAALALLGKTLDVVRALAIGQRAITVTMSSGVIEARPGETMGKCAARADEALYEAKRRGRDRVVAR